jgi:hypothetical protein
MKTAIEKHRAGKSVLTRSLLTDEVCGPGDLGNSAKD